MNTHEKNLELIREVLPIFNPEDSQPDDFVYTVKNFQGLTIALDFSVEDRVSVQAKYQIFRDVSFEVSVRDARATVKTLDYTLDAIFSAMSLLMNKLD